MPDLQAQITEARKHGYSDQDIASHLSTTAPDLSSKIKQAESSNYSASEILDFLGKQGQTNTPPSVGQRIGTAATKAALSLTQNAVGAAKEIGETAHNVTNALTFGTSNKIRSMAGVPPPNFNPSNSMQESGKTGMKIAETVLPIPGVEQIQAAKGAGLAARAGYGALRGAIDVGARATAETGRPSDAVKGAGVGAVVGGALGAASTLPSGLANTLKNFSRKQYAVALHPSGMPGKEVIEKNLLQGGEKDIVGRSTAAKIFQGKGGIALTQKGLLERFRNETQEAVKNLEAEHARLSPTARVSLKPVFNDFGAWLDKETVLPNGQIGSPELVKSGLQLMGRVADAFKGIPSPKLEDVRAFRQILDKEVFRNKLIVNPDSSGTAVKKAMVDSIRRSINTQHPSIGELNETVHLWEQATKVLLPTIRTKVGKEAFLQHLGLFSKPLKYATTGAVLGMMHGGRSETFAGAAAFAAIGAAMESTAWRTVSSVAIDRVSNLIASGRTQAAADIATRAVGLSIVRTTKPFKEYESDGTTKGPVKPPLKRTVSPPDATASSVPPQSGTSAPPVQVEPPQ